MLNTDSILNAVIEFATYTTSESQFYRKDIPPNTPQPGSVSTVIKQGSIQDPYLCTSSLNEQLNFCLS